MVKYFLSEKDTDKIINQPIDIWKKKSVYQAQLEKMEMNAQFFALQNVMKALVKCIAQGKERMPMDVRRQIFVCQ